MLNKMYLGEDSFFLSEVLFDYLKDWDKKIKILDMGSGSGIQAETCLKLGYTNVLCADINPESVDYLRGKGLEVIQSDLFDNITGKFDLVMFNPPYLPKDKHDSKLDTSGGKKGDETILKFLRQAQTHLNKNGRIILLLSSFTPRKRIDKLRLKKKKIAEKNLFFEKLEIFEFKDLDF